MIRFLCAMACASLFAAPSLTEEFRFWQSLDEETVATVSISDHPQVREAFEASALGKLLNSEAMVQRLEDFLRTHHSEIYQPLHAGMTLFGLSFADIPHLLSGDMGMGLQLRAAEDSENPADYTVLVWLTPGEDLNQRLLQALEMGLGMQEGPDERRVTRWDHQLAGHRVIELRGPAIETTYVPDNEGNWRAEDRPATNDPSFLVLMDSDRLLLSIQARRDDSTADQERLVSFVQATAHQQVQGFGSRILESASLSSQLRHDGPAYWEVYADIPRLLSLIPQEDDGPSLGPAPQEWIEALGFNQLGLMGLRSTILPNRSISNLFWELPLPRTGLFGILNQDAIGRQFPAWLQHSVLDGQVLRLDLAKVYEVVHHSLASMAPFIQMQFDQANQSAGMFFGADIPSILAAFGDVHEFAIYPQTDMEIAETEAALEQNDPASLNNPFRFAWVMNARDPELVGRVLNSIAPMAGLQAVEEQGYQGFRIEEPMIGLNIAIFHGNNQVLIAMGDGVAENTLNLQRNPPEATEQLAHSPVVQMLLNELPDKPIISLSMQNTAQNLRQSMGMWSFLFTNALGQALSDLGLHADQDLDALTSSILPSREAFTNAFGLTVLQAFVDEQGFGMNWIMELTAGD